MPISTRLGGSAFAGAHLVWSVGSDRLFLICGLASKRATGAAPTHCPCWLSGLATSGSTCNVPHVVLRPHSEAKSVSTSGYKLAGDPAELGQGAPSWPPHRHIMITRKKKQDCRRRSGWLACPLRLASTKLYNRNRKYGRRCSADGRNGNSTDLATELQRITSAPRRGLQHLEMQ